MALTILARASYFACVFASIGTNHRLEVSWQFSQIFSSCKRQSRGSVAIPHQVPRGTRIHDRRQNIIASLANYTTVSSLESVKPLLFSREDGNRCPCETRARATDSDDTNRNMNNSKDFRVPGSLRQRPSLRQRAAGGRSDRQPSRSKTFVNRAEYKWSGSSPSGFANPPSFEVSRPANRRLPIADSHKLRISTLHYSATSKTRKPTVKLRFSGKPALRLADRQPRVQLNQPPPR